MAREVAELTAGVGAPVGVLGLSHLGTVTAIGLARLGHRVVAVDVEPVPVASLRAGRVPVHEPGLESAFREVGLRLTVGEEAAALADADIVIVARDVPTTSDNRSDMGPVLRLVDAAIPHLRDGAVLAVMSQSPVGFTRAVIERIHRARPELAVSVVHWVETLVFGAALERFLRPERIILGCAEPAAPMPGALARIVDGFGCPVLRMSYESAELAKRAVNVYLALAVTGTNTLSDLCERVGADWDEIVPALRLDRRIGPHAYLRPGLGIAGGNLERDLVALDDLASAHGVDGTLLRALREHSASRYGWARERVAAALTGLNGRATVALWGLAYKKDTASTRNSPALRLAADLAGRASVRAYDPVVASVDPGLAVELCVSPRAALAGADCLVVMTDWDMFAAPEASWFQDMHRRIVIDCVGIGRRWGPLPAVEYVGMGRGWPA